jgi:orotidine-5'-phosphate decarboxylase
VIEATASAAESEIRRADAATLASAAVAQHCAELIGRCAPACVAVKLQLACFERLGAAGWSALGEVAATARDFDLLVIADGKRGDVPHTAEAYGQALVGATETPWGTASGLGADAFTANPLLGADALEPLLEAAEREGAGVFTLVRTSNPGAAALQDAELGGAPLHERLAELVAAQADRLRGSSGLSGAGAVVAPTEPGLLGRLRELLPDSIFLLPGVGAQGARPEQLGPALAADRPASILVPVSRAIAAAGDPGAEAERLRGEIWSAG